MSKQYKYTQSNLIDNKHIYDTTYDIAVAMTILSAFFNKDHPEHDIDYHNIKFRNDHIISWDNIKHDLESLIDDVISYNRSVSEDNK